MSVASVEPAARSIQLQLSSGVSVSVVIRSKSGAPISETVRVLATHSSSEQRLVPVTTYSHSDGTYSLPGLSPGRWSVRVETDLLLEGRERRWSVGDLHIDGHMMSQRFDMEVE
jgi:hypothetical protein